jgi:HAD superfamily hydrolase (TIGR01509 family)
MDGVLVDTAPFHLAAWQGVLRKRGVRFTAADFKRSFGQRNDTIIRQALGRPVTPEEIAAIAAEKEAAFRRQAGQQLRALPGAVPLLDSLKQRGFGLALASSAPRENVRLITGALGLEAYFGATVTGEDVTEGKPSPEGFLLAARRLGVAPPRCLVIEDAVAGVTAARRAGMRCLAVTSTHPGESLGEADLIVATLEGVTAADIEKLLTGA